ncbi:transposase family protein [Breznakiellaceae bacterium SP9]
MQQLTKEVVGKGLPVELRLTIALEYWREYRTMAHMAIDYGIPVSTLCDCITWYENIQPVKTPSVSIAY